MSTIMPAFDSYPKEALIIGKLLAGYGDLEFDFRYNERAGLGVTDDERTAKALRGIAGKRLTYRRTHAGA